jgi:hypothetical protein
MNGERRVACEQTARTTWPSELLLAMQIASRRWTGRCLLLLCWLTVGTSLPAAQDVVEVQHPKAESTVKRRGEIRGWEGTALTLETNGREESIPNEIIVRIDTAWSEEYQAARRLLEERQFAAAIQPLAKAAVAESRPWAASVIRADLVRALSATGSDFEAVQQFVLILARDPETRFMEFAPLAWDSGMVDAPFAALAQQCLASSKPNLQLLGASWLLGTAARAAAVELLGKLKQDIRPEVAHLAAAQLWRGEVPRASRTQVDSWARQIERMPNALRAGPLLVTGMAYARLDEKDRALLALLELPILHPDDFRLAATGLSRAAALLAARDDAGSARRLQSELVQRYPGTRWATEAGNQLEKK